MTYWLLVYMQFKNPAMQLNCSLHAGGNRGEEQKSSFLGINFQSVYTLTENRLTRIIQDSVADLRASNGGLTH